LGIKQGYQAVNNYSTGYSEAPGFKGIMAQSQLDYRYFNEDAGYGLVFFTDLADKLGVEVPNMKAVLRLSSVVMGRNYEEEKARTMESVGLDGYSPEELKKVL
jgi:opine dehydrogenase